MATFTVRLPDELHARLKSKAETDHRSVNGEIVYLLEVVLDSPVDTGLRAGKLLESPST